MIKIASRYMGEPENKISELLDDPSMASTIREIAGKVIQDKMPLLHKEFVVRLSIISRFCQNMSIAIAGVLISCTLAILIGWNEVPEIIKLAPEAALITTGFIFALGVFGVYIFAYRARRLRRNMIKFTFQIWYVVFQETGSKTNKKSNIPT